MDYTIIQIARLNNTPLEFSSPDVSYPLAPLVSSDYSDNENSPVLKIRATLCIDFKNLSTPTVESLIEKDDCIEIVFAYDYSDVIPDDYAVWYVEIECTSKSLDNIKNIVSYLSDVDPKTSRGTETRVQTTA